jgi:hypothetical protein
MQATKETKILLIRLIAQSSYSEKDRQEIAKAFNLHLEQSTFIVNSIEQKEIIQTLIKKQ